MTPNIISIVRARVDSTRLPRKMLLPIIDDKIALELMLDRVSRAKRCGTIVVATTVNKDDDAIVDLCKQWGYSYFRGSEEDVLDRCYQLSLAYLPLDAIVILTGDCLLLDSEILDESVEFFLDNNYDYVSNNNIPTTYPDGLDVEVISFDALKRMWQNATTKAEREHMTFYIQKNRDQFKTFNFRHSEDLSNKGWCLDTPQDYEFIKRIYEELYHVKPDFGMSDILNLLKKKPELEKINSDEGRNLWRDISSEEDDVDERDLTWKEK